MTALALMGGPPTSFGFEGAAWLAAGVFLAWRGLRGLGPDSRSRRRRLAGALLIGLLAFVGGHAALLSQPGLLLLEVDQTRPIAGESFLSVSDGRVYRLRANGGRQFLLLRGMRGHGLAVHCKVGGMISAKEVAYIAMIGPGYSHLELKGCDGRITRDYHPF